MKKHIEDYYEFKYLLGIIGGIITLLAIIVIKLRQWLGLPI